ncbi:MAG: dipeptidase [Deltaproteobacteria bacterium]|nr:dipeptidase [Deltaproteobacteria bacterium]
MFGSERARALHSSHPAIDLHADTLMWVRSVGYDMRERHEPPLPKAAFGGHVDVPRMIEGGMGAQFLGLVSLPHFHASPRDVVDNQLRLLDELLAIEPRAAKVRTAADIERCAREERVGLALGIEGAHALGGSLDALIHFASRGVRYLGLAHFSANDAASPAFGLGRDDSQGLTAFGREVVSCCEASEVLVDLAHINRAGFLEACELSTRPVLVSHTGITGAHRHWRNIDDDQLRAVARTGGVVGIIFAPTFLGDTTLGAVVRHIRHVIDVAGEDTPALGSDWDGMIIPTPELRDAAHLPLLTDALIDAGLSDAQVAKILRRNVMRVLA